MLINFEFAFAFILNSLRRYFDNSCTRSALQALWIKYLVFVIIYFLLSNINFIRKCISRTQKKPNLGVFFSIIIAFLSIRKYHLTKTSFVLVLSSSLLYQRSISLKNIFVFLISWLQVFSHLRRTWRRRIRDRGISHSRSKFNSTSVNMTLTSRAEGDFVHRSLCDKMEENGGDHLSRDANEQIPCENFKDDSLDNSCNRVLLSNNDT